MNARTEQEVRRSFVNCSRGEAASLTMPSGFAELDWSTLELLGWRDPKAPLRGYLVLERDGRTTGTALPGGRQTATLAENAAHLARLLKTSPYPS
jgi:hypothetical protein